jgi:Protein of unknown function (DUF2939)
MLARHEKIAVEDPWCIGMRKAIAIIAALAVVWIGYTAWPIYDLFVLVRAVDSRDLGTVTQHVYFDRIRASFTNQIVAAYLRRTGTEITPRARQMAAIGISIADPVVRKLISPEALADLLSAGWPVTVVPDPAPGTIGISSNTVGTIWQVFGAAEYGVARFEVSAPAELSSAHRFRLTFQLLNWRWRLVGITLPEHIQNVLADEVLKAVQKPTP